MVYVIWNADTLYQGLIYALQAKTVLFVQNPRDTFAFITQLLSNNWTS